MEQISEWFSYGGDASVKRPELNKDVSDQKCDDFCIQKSLRGKHLELGNIFRDVGNG